MVSMLVAMFNFTEKSNYELQFFFIKSPTLLNYLMLFYTFVDLLST